MKAKPGKEVKSKKETKVQSKKETTVQSEAKGSKQKPFWLFIVAVGGALMAIVGALALQYDGNISAPVVSESQASSPDSAAVHANKIEELVEWIENNGGFVEKQISVSKDLVNGRGVFWKGPTPTVPSTQLFKIPQTIFISAKSMKDERSVMGKLFIDPSLAQELKAESTQLKAALVLMAEIENVDSSFWKPYIKLLPKDDPEQPLFWKDFSELQSPLLVRSVQGSINYLKSKNALLYKLSDTFPDIFPSKELIFDKFLWAFYLVSSRSFMFEIDGTSMHAMIPFADLFNHGFPGKSNISVTSFRNVDGSNMMSGLASISATLIDGEEIYNEYQNVATPTATFLHRYGMVDENFVANTSGDYVMLKYQGSYYTIYPDGSVSGLDAASIPNLSEKVTEGIQVLPTTLEQDKALLMSSKVPKSALLIRIRFKQVLLNLQNWIASGAPPSNKEAKSNGQALFELDVTTY